MATVPTVTWIPQRATRGMTAAADIMTTAHGICVEIFTHGTPTVIDLRITAPAHSGIAGKVETLRPDVGETLLRHPENTAPAADPTPHTVILWKEMLIAPHLMEIYSHDIQHWRTPTLPGNNLRQTILRFKIRKL